MFPLPFPALVYPPSVIQTLWPIGTCFYIKEPYARMGAKGRTEIAIAWPKDMVEVPRVAGIFDHPAVTVSVAVCVGGLFSDTAARFHRSWGISSRRSCGLCAKQSQGEL
jgi:hypothetical protein